MTPQQWQWILVVATKWKAFAGNKEGVIIREMLGMSLPYQAVNRITIEKTWIQFDSSQVSNKFISEDDDYDNAMFYIGSLRGIRGKLESLNDLLEEW